MAINSDNRLKDNHVFYCAKTGGGKGVAIQNLEFEGMIPKKPQLAVFDPYDELKFKRGEKHTGFRNRKVVAYKTRSGFAKAFFEAWQSGKPFLIRYTPTDATREDMLWFTELMWQASDGNRRLDVLIYEVSKFSLGAGAEPSESPFGRCMTVGRKFHLCMHLDFQTPTEVSKTLTKQCVHKVVGTQSANIECKRMAEEVDKDYRDVGMLKPCTYWVKGRNFGDTQFMSLRHLFPDLVEEDRQEQLNNQKQTEKVN